MPGGGTYTMIEVGTGTGGGMTINQAPGVPPHWMAYVGVDDIRASTKKAKDLGAKVVVDVMEVGEHGTMSVIDEATGPLGAGRASFQRLSPRVLNGSRTREGSATGRRRRDRATGRSAGVTR